MIRDTEPEEPAAPTASTGRDRGSLQVGHWGPGFQLHLGRNRGLRPQDLLCDCPIPLSPAVCAWANRRRMGTAEMAAAQKGPPAACDSSSTVMIELQFVCVRQRPRYYVTSHISLSSLNSYLFVSSSLVQSFPSPSRGISDIPSLGDTRGLSTPTWPSPHLQYHRDGARIHRVRTAMTTGSGSITYGEWECWARRIRPRHATLQILLLP